MILGYDCPPVIERIGRRYQRLFQLLVGEKVFDISGKTMLLVIDRKVFFWQIFAIRLAYKLRGYFPVFAGCHWHLRNQIRLGAKIGSVIEAHPSVLLIMYLPKRDVKQFSPAVGTNNSRTDAQCDLICVSNSIKAAEAISFKQIVIGFWKQGSIKIGNNALIFKRCIQVKQTRFQGLYQAAFSTKNTLKYQARIQAQSRDWARDRILIRAVIIESVFG